VISGRSSLVSVPRLQTTVVVPSALRTTDCGVCEGSLPGSSESSVPAGSTSVTVTSRAVATVPGSSWLGTTTCGRSANFTAVPPRTAGVAVEEDAGSTMSLKRIVWALLRIRRSPRLPVWLSGL